VVDKEGLSGRKVLDRLNEKHLVPRKANRSWAKSSTLRILRSEVYTGVWYYNKHESCVPYNPSAKQRYRKNAKSSRRLRRRSEWLPVLLPEHLKMIKRDQWERVQKQLDRNIAFSPRNEKHTYLLKGLIRCGGCAARYVGQPCHGQFYYRCMARCKMVPSIKEEHLNQTVWAAVEEAILNPDLIMKQLARLTENGNTDASKSAAEVAEAEQGLLQIRREEARLIEAYRLGILSAAQLGQELEKTNSRKPLWTNGRLAFHSGSGTHLCL